MMNPPYLIRTFLLAFFHLYALLALAAGAEQKVRVTNTAKYVGGGRYDWAVSLLADDATLNSVSYVEYTLHPSFPNPVRRVSDRKSKFALSSNGWGEFNIQVKIVYKDGRTSELQQWLKLKQTSQAQTITLTVPSHQHGKLTTENTSKHIGGDRWDWTVSVVGDDKTLGEISCIEYTLHPTFPDPVRKVCDRGAIAGKGFALNSNGWGTFTVGVKVVFKDGDDRYLSHQLSFSEQKK